MVKTNVIHSKYKSPFAQLRLSVGVSWGLAEALYVFNDEFSMDGFSRVVESLEERVDFSGSFISHKGNLVVAELETDWSNVSESNFGRENQSKLVNLSSNKLSNSPLLLILLELEENINHILSLFGVEHLQEQSQILDGAMLDFIIYAKID